MRAYDTKPQSGAATDVKPGSSSTRTTIPSQAEGSIPVRDTVPQNGRAYTGAPKLPEGSGSGYTKLIRLADGSIGPEGAGGTETLPVTVDNTNHLILDATSSECAYILDADQTGLDLSGAFTISWFQNFQGSQITGSKYIIAKHLSSAGERGIQIFWNLDASPDRLTITLFQNDATSGQAYWNIPRITDVWHHYCITFTPSVILTSQYELFINGQSQGNGTTSGTSLSSVNTNSQPFVIGALTSTGTSSLSVWLDSVKVYNQVKAIADVISYSTSSLTTEAGLVAFWKFDNDYVDSSSSGNDLTAVNTPTFGTNLLFTVYGRLTKFNTSMHGYVLRGQQLGFRSTTWTTIHGATVGDTTGVVTNDNLDRVSVERGQAGTDTWTVYRPFLVFATSIIPGPIVGSFLWLYTNTATSFAGVADQNLCLVQPTPASESTLVAEDFDQAGSVNSPTEGATRFSWNNVEAGVWFVLDSTGLTWLNAGGNTNLALRIDHDLSDTTPPHTGAQRTVMEFNTTDSATDYFISYLGVITTDV